MHSCKHCHRSFKNNAGKSRHEMCCDGTGSKLDKRKRATHRRILCNICEEQFQTPQARGNHEKHCDGSGRKKTPTKFPNGVGRSLSDGHRAKLSESLKGNTTWADLPIERKVQLASAARERINERYASGWQPVAGRCKKYTYTSLIAGVVRVDGKWELAVCEYFDALGVTWQRNTKRFSYTRPDGEQSTYCPDFWVDDWSSYIEVKGYETKLDHAKWRDFPAKLIVWRKQDLLERKII